MHLIMLPSSTNTEFEYYAHWHLQHHAALGTQDHHDLSSIFELQGLDGDLLAVTTYVIQANRRLQERRKLHFPLLGELLAHLLHELVSIAWGLFNACFFPLYVALAACLLGRDAAFKRLPPKEQANVARLTRLLRIAVHCGLHAWLNIAALCLMLVTDAGELTWRFDTVPSLHRLLVTLLYLSLSEMFMHGFAWHPYAGYFLTVHSSQRVSEDSEARSLNDVESSSAFASGEEAGGCQPTVSTYSLLASVLSGNLNYHTEHHDFPTIPWTRLPAVKSLAPEFYGTLVSSPGYFRAIWNHVSRSSQDGGYGCT